MERERWQQIDKLLQSALELKAEARSAFLHQACAGDEALRQEVESLLAANEEVDSFIESPVFEGAAALLTNDQTNSLLGRRLGAYQILSQLGVGGMGEVYLAQDIRLARKVALKLLDPDWANNSQLRQRLMREARLAASLDHPNICIIHEIGDVAGQLFIAMQYVEGQTLREVINGRPLSMDSLISTGIQVADALSTAHGQGIIHRDIKPSNIIITPRGQAKVLDFGLAKLLDEERDQTEQGLTKTGAVMGTPAYMSPEQARGEPADHRSDIFSFGVVLYEMVTGQTPFKAKSQPETLNAVINQQHTPVIELNRESPREFSAIIDRALAKAPDKRYQTMPELSDDLRQVAQLIGLTTSGLDGGMNYIQPARSGWSNSLTSLIKNKAFMIGLLVIAAIALLWWQPWVRKLTTPPPQQYLLSTFPGSHRAASFSPDANRIAFINTVDGKSQVWVKGIPQGEPVQLTFGPDNATRPRWSPDGEQIIYVRSSSESPGIWSAPAAGGTPRKIIEGGRNANWSGDGKRLVFERGAGEIWTANADGSNQHKLDGVPTTDLVRADRMPAFSPDGSLVAYFQDDKGPIGDYWVIPSTGGQARRLTFDVIHGGAPTWTPDGKYIICPSQRAGSKTLWKVPVAGGKPEPVLLSAGEDVDPEISRDGRKLIYTNTRNNYALVMTDPATGETKTLHESRSDIFDPSFSPQGDKILFFGMTVEGDLQILKINTDGSQFTQLTGEKGERNIHPRWSADGSAVYFYQIRPTTSLRKMLIGDPQSSEMVSGWEWGTQYGARIDPGGKRIIYARLDRGIVVATMIRDLESGQETAFSTLLRHPSWSLDGQYVLGVDGTIAGNRMPDVMICPADGGPCRKLTKGYFPHWSPDGLRIYCQRDGTLKDGTEIWSISNTGQDERRIFDMRPMHPIGQFFDVSAKGKIVWVRFDRGKNELWLSDFSGESLK